MITETNLVDTATKKGIVFWSSTGLADTAGTGSANVKYHCWKMTTTHEVGTAKTAFKEDSGGKDGYFIGMQDNCVTITRNASNGQIIATNRLSGCGFSIYYHPQKDFYVGAHVYRGKDKNTEADIEKYASTNGLTEIAGWSSAGMIGKDGVQECWGIAFLRGGGQIRLVALGQNNKGQVVKLFENKDYSS